MKSAGVVDRLRGPRGRTPAGHRFSFSIPRLVVYKGNPVRTGTTTSRRWGKGGNKIPYRPPTLLREGKNSKMTGVIEKKEVSKVRGELAGMKKQRGVRNMLVELVDIQQKWGHQEGHGARKSGTHQGVGGKLQSEYKAVVAPLGISLSGYTGRRGEKG